MRQFQFRVGHKNFALIHVSLVPDMHGEQKTKPTQTTIHSLRGLGLLADLIACRLLASDPLLPATKEKISMFCHVAAEQVFGVHNVSSVYHVPLLLQSQGILDYLRKRLDLDNISITPNMSQHGTSLEKRWRALTTGARAVIRYCANCPRGQVYRPQGLLHVCYQGFGTLGISSPPKTHTHGAFIFLKVGRTCFLFLSFSGLNLQILSPRRRSRIRRNIMTRGARLSAPGMNLSLRWFIG